MMIAAAKGADTFDRFLQSHHDRQFSIGPGKSQSSTSSDFRILDKLPHPQYDLGQEFDMNTADDLMINTSIPFLRTPIPLILASGR